MTQKPNDFYVGYLNLPPSLRLLIPAMVLVLLLLVMFDAWLVASLQPQSGDGKWADTPKEFVGTLNRDPYPTLRVRQGGTTLTFVVISDEKRGAEAALEKFVNGAAIKLYGYEIERAAVGMIQLAATTVELMDTVPTIPPATHEIHGRVTLTGEIVDSKCWLGVMRPGDGHIHKSCASLCIRGGIPPLFVTRSTAGPQVLLMTTFDGAAIPPEKILDYVADDVAISGLIEKRDDLYIFKADLSTLARSK